MNENYYVYPFSKPVSLRVLMRSIEENLPIEVIEFDETCQENKANYFIFVDDKMYYYLGGTWYYLTKEEYEAMGIE